MLGLLVAATGGLLPAVMAVGWSEASTRRSRYQNALPLSLKLLFAAIIVLTLAAGIEAAVISGRNP